MNPAIIANCARVIEYLTAAHPELAEDEDFRRDVLEGQSDLFGVVERLARESRAVKAEVAGLREQAVELVARSGKKAEREQAIRQAILGLMNAADLTKIKTATASVSIASLRPSVVVTDETALPDQFIRVKREADKAAIKAALEAGESVPGASLSNGGTTLRIV